MKPLGLLLPFALLGCVHTYEAPSPDQPHAVVKIRRTYEQTAGVQLHESLNVDEYRAYGQTIDAEMARSPRNDAVLVHPRPATMSVDATFFHHETKRVMETYTEQEPYSTTESYSCGTGTSFRTCTRPTTKYRSVSKTRWVTKTVEVVDKTCQAAVRFAPARNASYLLQYTFQDHKACALSCFEQTPDPAGGLRNSPCPVAPAVE
jgi:hypothetical protein